MIGNTANWVKSSEKPTMVLNLYEMSVQMQRSIVLHHFGHALGLEHEHQRHDFWDVLETKSDSDLEDYQFVKEMDHLQKLNELSKKSNWHEEFDYDPESIMHCW